MIIGIRSFPCIVFGVVEGCRGGQVNLVEFCNGGQVNLPVVVDFAVVVDWVVFCEVVVFKEGHEKVLLTTMGEKKEKLKYSAC